MNIVFASHAPWRPTGYGAPVMLITSILKDLGHDVMILAIDSKGPGLVDYKGLEIALMDETQFGEDIIREVCTYFRADLVISLFDPWVLGEEGFSERKSGAPWVAWFPIDQEPLPYALGKQLGYAKRSLPFSQYGVDVLKRAGVDRVSQMPYPIDTDLFAPVKNAKEKIEAKEKIGIPSTCLTIGICGTNLPGDRKALAEQIEGYAQYVEHLDGDHQVRLLLLTEPYGGVSIPLLTQALEVQDQCIFFTDFTRRYQFSRHEKLLHFYQACDLLLHASVAEGFGICIAEALACGTPVIVSPTTSMTEVAGGAGIVLNRDLHRVISPHGGWWYRPTPTAVCNALLEFDTRYFDHTLPEVTVMRDAAKRYSPDQIKKLWKKVLKEVSNEN